MAIGDSSNFAGESYLMVGRETGGSYGTYNTCTANLPFLSSSMKMLKEGKILEQIETGRTYSKRIEMGRVLEGDIEGYFYPQYTACAHLLHNAMGGAITSATSTGETAGGSAITHTFAIGNLDDHSYGSLCLNMRKGHTTTGQVFEYSGLRINELNFTAELDESLKFTASVVGKDATTTTNDLSGNVACTATSTLVFVDGRVSVEDALASITTTSFWHVQSVNFGIANSLKSDSESRRIGSDTLDVLPQGIASFPVTVTMRFDTTTAYDSMIGQSSLALQLEFQGPTLSSSVIRQGLKLTCPKVSINDAGDPEIGGPDEILTSEVVFHVLKDDSSASGYAMQAELTNEIANYN